MCPNLTQQKSKVGVQICQHHIVNLSLTHSLNRSYSSPPMDVEALTSSALKFASLAFGSNSERVTGEEKEEEEEEEGEEKDQRGREVRGTQGAKASKQKYIWEGS